MIKANLNGSPLFFTEIWPLIHKKSIKFVRNLRVMLMHKKYHFGVALSGGGAKGFAHIGVMKALDEFGLVPDVIAGVSAGAVMAAFYSSGVTPDDTLKAFSQIRIGDLTSFSVPSNGLLKFDGFAKFLKKNLPVERIEQLHIPTIITATNLDTYKEDLFTSGPLVNCVLASCSLPVVFKPTKVNGHTYIDGGVLHNLPAFALRDKCDVLLGVNVSPLNTSPFKSSIADIAYRSYRLMTTHNSKPDLELCDVVINVDSMKKISTFDVKKMADNAKEGYFAAMKVLVNSPILKQLRDERK